MRLIHHASKDATHLFGIFKPGLNLNAIDNFVNRFKVRRIWALIMLFFLIGCNPEPVPIQYGHDNCAYCMMTIVDAKHGSELLTKKGKAFKFDSVECLAGYYMEEKTPHDQVFALLVPDFQGKPGSFVEVDRAVFLQSEKLRSPMGLGLTAFADSQQAVFAQEEFDGELLDWAATTDYVKKSWLE